MKEHLLSTILLSLHCQTHYDVLEHYWPSHIEQLAYANTEDERSN